MAYLSFLKSLYSVDDLSTNIKLLMRDRNKSLFMLNQIYSQNLQVYQRIHSFLIQNRPYLKEYLNAVIV